MAHSSDSNATLDIPTSVSLAEHRDAYLKALIATAKAAVPRDFALGDLRTRAESLLKEETFPSTRQEDWRFTDPSALLSVNFAAVEASTVAEAATGLPRLPETTGAQIVLVNGVFSAELSQLEPLPEAATVGSLRHLSRNPDLMVRLQECLGQASGGHEVFTALNTVGFQDGVVIYLPRNLVVETPIHLLYVSRPQDRPTLAQPRCLVVAEPGSTLTLVEDFWGLGDQRHLTNAVTELWLGANAQVSHSRIQREGHGTYHIGKTVTTQARDSHYRGTAVDLGAKLARHTWETYQTGEQTTTQIYGLSAITDTQHADTHSLVALQHPYGCVEQQHKAIVDGKAHSVFNGRIAVAQAAQQTNASQINRNLLLSDTARVDTKPQLEIVANDVKCAHGATVSQLQADEIFYLQSRGISAPQAQRLLIYAFAMEILDRIPLDSLRATLAQRITQWT